MHTESRKRKSRLLEPYWNVGKCFLRQDATVLFGLARCTGAKAWMP